MEVAARNTGVQAEGPVLRGLGAAGAVIMAVGIGMLLMPFVGPLVGLPFDGAEAWVVDRNRLLLHVFPGVVGIAAGYALLHAQRARTREGTPYPEWLKPAIAIALVVAIWSGIGPWVVDALLPAQAGTGLMFTQIPGFAGLSSADQLVLQLVCHWLPGALALGAAWMAFVLARRLPAGTHTAA